MSKQRVPPFLNNSPFSPIPSFLEKIFYSHSPYCQIRGSQSPPFRGGFEQNLANKNLSTRYQLPTKNCHASTNHKPKLSIKYQSLNQKLSITDQKLLSQ